MWSTTSAFPRTRPVVSTSRRIAVLRWSLGRREACVGAKPAKDPVLAGSGQCLGHGGQSLVVFEHVVLLILQTAIRIGTAKPQLGSDSDHEIQLRLRFVLVLQGQKRDAQEPHGFGKRAVIREQAD